MTGTLSAAGRPGRALRRAWALWILFILAGSAVLARVARGVPNLFLEDDAYFYLQIAWNIGSGAGSTFDGLHVTDGYHLLWMGVLSPVAFLAHAAGAGKAGFLIAACGVSLAIIAVTAHTAFRSTWERLLAVLIFLSCGLLMETTLLGALLVVVYRAGLGEIASRRWPVLLASMLVPVARIDYSWMPVALALVGRRSRSWHLPLAPTLLGTAAGIGAHFACQRVLFGTWTSVSSAFVADRSYGGPLACLAWNLTNSGNQLRYVVVACLAAVAVIGFGRRRAWTHLATLAVALIPLAAYSGLIRVRDWYALAPLLLTLLLASRAGAEAPRARRAVTVALSILVVTASAAYLVLHAPDMRRTARFIEAANRLLDDGDVVFGAGGMGFVGWRLGVPVINGDGLVNSWEYRDRLLARRLDTYFQENGVTHVITNDRATGLRCPGCTGSVPASPIPGSSPRRSPRAIASCSTTCSS